MRYRCLLGLTTAGVLFAPDLRAYLWTVVPVEPGPGVTLESVTPTRVSGRFRTTLRSLHPVNPRQMVVDGVFVAERVARITDLPRIATSSSAGHD